MCVLEGYSEAFFLGEAAGTANGSGAAWKDGKVDQGLVFTPDTEVKLVRYNAVRQVQTFD